MKVGRTIEIRLKLAQFFRNAFFYFETSTRREQHHWSTISLLHLSSRTVFSLIIFLEQSPTIACQTPGGRLIEVTTTEELSCEWPKGGHLTVVLFAIVFCNCLLTDYWLLKMGWLLNGGSTVCFGQEPF